MVVVVVVVDVVVVVEEGGEEGEGEGDGMLLQQKQKPHNTMWGKTANISHAGGFKTWELLCLSTLEYTVSSGYSPLFQQRAFYFS